MKDDLKEILLTEQEIAARVKALGAEITADYAGRSPLLIGVLKGCFVFLADLARAIDISCEIRFLTASSYGFSSVTSGTVTISKQLDFEMEGRDVLIIEDILDSGVTLKALRDYVTGMNPASLRICALLDKPSRREVQVDVDYLGFEVPDEFLVGYGLDYAERYRNLPFVASLKPEVYK
jgi:hypoxanthine phosphoribosyltransferase